MTVPEITAQVYSIPMMLLEISLLLSVPTEAFRRAMSMTVMDSLSLPQTAQEQERTSTMTLVAEEHVLKRKAMRLSSMSMMPLAISQVW